jgi:LPXTG-motif cell wall-anchored protein
LGISEAYIESVNEREDWFTAETPPGLVFGPNGPSDVENVITLSNDNANEGVLTITFNNPVPAGELGVAIGDLDSNEESESESDRALVEATTGAGADLTSAELNGAVFNMCNVTVNADMPTDCEATQLTTAPVMTEPTATSVKFSGNTVLSDGTGEFGWVHPTTDVKSVTITWNGWDGGSSTRVYVAVKKNLTLPDTGVDVVSVALTSMVLGLLGTAALIAVRRRRA